ncbi:MAG: hypothetical protein Pg6C_05990 [Treponemataceae bacterium]|nr:MAG: hypothetical protein Pg6C_05990 [Treponemataceae bacterium]
MRLFSKDFSLVIAGQIVSILGSSILRFALNLYVPVLITAGLTFITALAAKKILPEETGGK